MKEKNKKIIILVVILILIAVVIVKYQNQKNIAQCKKECIYNVNDEVWHYGEGGRLYSREFPTQESCVDYCLIDLKE